MTAESDAEPVKRATRTAVASPDVPRRRVNWLLLFAAAEALAIACLSAALVHALTVWPQRNAYLHAASAFGGDR